jgi:hypothetical protein
MLLLLSNNAIDILFLRFLNNFPHRCMKIDGFLFEGSPNPSVLKLSLIAARKNNSCRGFMNSFSRIACRRGATLAPGLLPRA